MGTKRPRNGPENWSVRQRLLEGAAELFTKKGYAASTTREIVAAAGVTKPVLYYYFRNKEGIYLQLMREAFSKFHEVIQDSLQAQGTAAEKLLGLCDRVYSLFMENVRVARVMYGIYYGPQQGAPFFDFDSYHLEFVSAIRSLIEEGIRRKEFQKKDAGEMAWAVVGAINVAMEVHLGRTELEFGREGLSRVLRIIFEGISAKPRRGKGERG